MTIHVSATTTPTLFEGAPSDGDTNPHYTFFNPGIIASVIAEITPTGDSLPGVAVYSPSGSLVAYAPAGTTVLAGVKTLVCFQLGGIQATESVDAPDGVNQALPANLPTIPVDKGYTMAVYTAGGAADVVVVDVHLLK